MSKYNQYMDLETIRTQLDLIKQSLVENRINIIMEYANVHNSQSEGLAKWKEHISSIENCLNEIQLLKEKLKSEMQNAQN